MKKTKTLIICILALVLCVSVLVACTPAEEVLDDVTLTKMVQVVDSNNRNKAAETPVDYQLPGTVSYAGRLCHIKWIATNGVTVSDPDADGYVTVDVNEEAPEDIDYTITATLVNSKNEAYKNAEGKAYTVSFNRVTKQFIVAAYEDYVANCKSADADKASINIKAYVIAIVLPSSGSSSKGSMYLQDKDGHGYYAYAPTLANGLKDDDAKILAEYPYGTEVYVSGTGTVYGGQYEFNKGCAIRKTGNVATAEELEMIDASAAFAAAAGNQDDALIPYQNAMVELKSCTMTRITQSNGKDVYFWFKVGDSDVEFNLYRTNYFMSGEDADELVKKFAVGNKATFRGVVVVYSKSYQIYPMGMNAIDDIVEVTYTDEEKATMDTDNISLSTTKIAADGAEITLPATGKAYGSAITWAIKEEQTVAEIKDGKLTVAALPEEAATITLVATVKSGDVTKEKEIAIEIAMKQPDNGVILNVDTLALGAYAKNSAATQATVNGAKFEYVDVGQYGNGIQIRNSSGSLYNTVALNKITSVTIVLNPEKMPTEDYKTNFIVQFATSADFANAQTVSYEYGADGATTINVEIPAGDFTFIRITRPAENASGTPYITSITIMWEAPAAE